MNEVAKPHINSRLLETIQSGSAKELSSLASQINQGAFASEVLLGKIFHRLFQEGTWKEAMPAANNFWDFAYKLTSRSQSTVFEWMENYKFFCEISHYSEEKLAQMLIDVGWTKLRELRIRALSPVKIDGMVEEIKEQGTTRKQLAEKLNDEHPVEEDEKQRYYAFKANMPEFQFKKVLEVLALVSDGSIDRGEQLYRAMMLLEQHIGYETIDTSQMQQQPLGA